MSAIGFVDGGLRIAALGDEEAVLLSASRELRDVVGVGRQARAREKVRESFERQPLNSRRDWRMWRWKPGGKRG